MLFIMERHFNPPRIFASMVQLITSLVFACMFSRARIHICLS
ncbi:hypothetical protein HMPREF3232_00292 [Fannyhessea vaginae]|nr:hypothetical protein HMPREF3232_00292 [Fannyhessea vaginae]